MTSLHQKDSLHLSCRRSRIAAAACVFIVLGTFQDSVFAQTALEKTAWVSGSVVALGVYDYLGYNLTRDTKTELAIYRVSFVLLQAGITYILYEKFGLPSAIGFNLIWWTFGVDMVYYGVAELNPNTGGKWSARGAWDAESRPGLRFASWTPVGLARGARRGVDPIARNTIVAQAIVGFALGISITITF